MSNEILSLPSSEYAGNSGGGILPVLINTSSLGLGNSSYLPYAGRDNNVLLGVGAGAVVDKGDYNTVVGRSAFSVGTGDGTNNVAVGCQSLLNGTDTNHNTAVGFQSLQTNASGTHNTAVGSKSGTNISNGSTNTCLGYNTGVTLVSGSDNILLGANVDVSVAARANCLVIGKSGTSAANDGSTTIDTSYLRTDSTNISNQALLYNSSTGEVLRGNLNASSFGVASGTATLVGGEIAVADANILATSIIYVTVYTPAVAFGSRGLPYIYEKNTGVGFTIKSTDAADTSVIHYVILRY